MKKLLEKEVCGSCEQCMGPTGVHCPLFILWSNVFHCPMNSDRQHLHVLLNFFFKKKEEEGKHKTPDAGFFIRIQTLPK